MELYEQTRPEYEPGAGRIRAGVSEARCAAARSTVMAGQCDGGVAERPEVGTGGVLHRFLMQSGRRALQSSGLQHSDGKAFAPGDTGESTGRACVRTFTEHGC